MNKIFIMNNYRFIDFSSFKESASRMCLHHDNTGNLAFLESCCNIIKNSEAFSFWEHIYNKKNTIFDNPNNTVVFPMANFISEHWKCSDILIEKVKNSKAKIILFSVGVQAKDFNHLKSIKISEHCKVFLNKASENPNGIGVRGKITKEFLEKNGYKGVSVIGCPSIFKNLNNFKSIDNDIKFEKIAFHNGYSYNFSEKFKIINSFMIKNSDSFVSQNDGPLFVRKHNIDSSFLKKYNLKETILFKNNLNLNKFYNSFVFKNEHDIFDRWIVNNYCHFWNIEDWGRHSLNYDLFLGTRIHGTFVPLSFGVPSAIIATDLRTHELADHHGVPKLDINNINCEQDLKNFISNIDFSNYNNLYMKNKKIMHDFLNKNNMMFNDE